MIFDPDCEEVAGFHGQMMVDEIRAPLGLRACDEMMEEFIADHLPTCERCQAFAVQPTKGQN